MHATLQAVAVRHANADGTPIGPSLTQIYVDARGNAVDEAQPVLITDGPGPKPGESKH